MKKRVMRKNVTRKEEEVQGGLVWKMLGRRGDRREVQVKLWDGETVNQEGWVVREGGRQGEAHERQYQEPSTGSYGVTIGGLEANSEREGGRGGARNR